MNFDNLQLNDPRITDDCKQEFRLRVGRSWPTAGELEPFAAIWAMAFLFGQGQQSDVQPEAVQVPLCVRTAPERIWLQADINGMRADDPFENDGVTWCAESVGGAEVEYIRADLATSQSQSQSEVRAREVDPAERERTKTLARWINAILSMLESIDPDDMEDGGSNLRGLIADGDALVSAVLRGEDIPAPQRPAQAQAQAQAQAELHPDLLGADYAKALTDLSAETEMSVRQVLRCAIRLYQAEHTGLVKMVEAEKRPGIYSPDVQQAQAKPCDMGPICIGCEPRGPRGECPGAQAEARGDEPTGAVINGRTLMDRLEMGYSFDCEAGPLRLCSDWVELRRCFEHLADYVSRPAPAAPQAGEADWRRHVEQRLASWRQRLVNRSGDQLALDDFMDKESLDDLLDYVLSEYEGPASQPMSRDGLSQAAHDVLAERQRQIEAEGWTPEHDDAHHDGTLAQAAGCYATWAFEGEQLPNWVPTGWPWADSWWKPSTPRLNLIRAGALILAELERLDRASAHGIGSGSGKGVA